MSNKLVCIAFKSNNEKTVSFYYPFDHEQIKSFFSSVQLLVGFNLKFDLAWLRREFAITPPQSCRLWDCQYAEFLFSNQTWKYPDLNSSCLKNNIPAKIDKIAEYWEKGIDTFDIDKEELLEYNEHDVEITYQLYLKQKEKLEKNPQLYRLFRLHMLDLPVLLEMEWNGLLYNSKKSLELSEDLTKQIQHIEGVLNEFAGLEINWGSGDEKSAFLYGGSVERESRIPIGIYKSGLKQGQVRYKIVSTGTTFSRRVEPLNGTEYKKGGVWSTDEPTLRSLQVDKETKKIIDLILERAKLEKLNGTYLKGLPKKLIEMEWGDYLHPSYIQCATVTGRVASANPNGQNLAPQAKQLCESRFT